MLRDDLLMSVIAALMPLRVPIKYFTDCPIFNCVAGIAIDIKSVRGAVVWLDTIAQALEPGLPAQAPTPRRWLFGS